MKNTTFYKIGALSLALLSAGVFTSFDDAMTDEQKIDMKYNELVMAFNMEQAQLCKSQALAMAQAEWARMQQEMAAGDGSVTPPAYNGGSRPRPSTGSNNSNYSGGNEPPTTTTTPNTPTNPKDNKMSGQKATTDKTDKMNRTDDAKSGNSDVTNKKKDKMNGNK